MLGIFGGTQSGHPLADLKEAKRIAAALPAGEAFASLEEIAHWLESVKNEAGFKPEYRAQLVQLFDEAGQAHARKLSREYLAAARQGKREEQRLWKAIHAFWSEVALGYVTCLDAYATGAKGGDALKGSLVLLGARALRALAQQLKWLQVRYGPIDERLWTMMSRTYALLEAKKVARTKVVPYPGLGPESTPGARVPARGDVQRVLAGQPAAAGDRDCGAGDRPALARIPVRVAAPARDAVLDRPRAGRGAGARRARAAAVADHPVLRRRPRVRRDRRDDPAHPQLARRARHAHARRRLLAGHRDRRARAPGARAGRPSFPSGAIRATA